jgi:hypothetical protein
MTTLRTINIPDWDAEGYLPALLGHETMEVSHPPYPVSLTDLVRRFRGSDRRREILSGFLGFRANLYHAGLNDGIQWINGSFVNDKMSQKGEEPGDIDVITLFNVPPGVTQQQLLTGSPELFGGPGVNRNKELFDVDSYFVSLNSGSVSYTTKSIAFWNNLWYHTKEGRRKGFLSVDLAPNEDQDAANLL